MHAGRLVLPVVLYYTLYPDRISYNFGRDIFLLLFTSYQYCDYYKEGEGKDRRF